MYWLPVTRIVVPYHFMFHTSFLDPVLTVANVSAFRLLSVIKKLASTSCTLLRFAVAQCGRI
jgi:hypothetical protein